MSTASVSTGARDLILILPVLGERLALSTAEPTTPAWLMLWVPNCGVSYKCPEVGVTTALESPPSRSLQVRGTSGFVHRQSYSVLPPSSEGC